MAACAAPRYFPSIKIGPANEEFIDAGFGCNNPIVELHREVDRLYDGDREVGCIISLGTGERRLNQVEEPSLFDRIVPRHLIKAMKRLTVTSDIKADEMEARYSGSADLYFRFNVGHGLENIGLADARKLSIVRDRTLEYAQKPSVSAMLDTAASIIAGTPGNRRTYTVAQICTYNK